MTVNLEIKYEICDACSSPATWRGQTYMELHTNQEKDNNDDDDFRRQQKLPQQEMRFVCLFVFVDLRSKSTAIVMAGRSVHLTTLFPGQALTRGLPVIRVHTFACI